MRSHRVSGLFERPIVDNFAGGGGASLGISMAMGRDVDVAINHDPVAVAMHTENHPETAHLCEDVFKVDPRRAVRGRPILGWFSPDCTHFSRAKGAKPVAKKIRGLAWVAVKWARLNPPDVIMLENVREFETWGPLIPKTDGGRAVRYFERKLGLWLPAMVPDPARMGLTFKRFVGTLRGLGYEVEWRVLNAADYGAPTHRRRLFLVARRDGRAIVWPERTHGERSKCEQRPVEGSIPAGPVNSKRSDRDQPGRFFIQNAEARDGTTGGSCRGDHQLTEHDDRLKPWRTAAECIDWSIPCPSIFDRKRPLAEKTQRRIAMGIKRYVLDNPRPFIVRCQHGGDEFRGQSVDAPLGTVTAKHGYGVVSPTLVQTGYGERPGQAPRVPGLDKPLGACVNGQKHALVTAHLQGVGGPDYSGKPTAADRPKGSVLPQDRTALVTAWLSQFFGGRVGKPATDPVPTVTACDHNAVATAVLVGVGGRAGQSPPCGVQEPLRTATAKGDRALAAVQLTKFYTGAKRKGSGGGAGAASPCIGTTQAASVDEPLGTVTAQSGRFGLVYSFLTKYFGTAVGQEIDAPLHTVTGRDRFGVVTVEVEGVTYAIADIGLRMLSPRELARAQGFPDDYQLPAAKSRAVKFIGNSVPPPVVEALVRANLGGPSIADAGACRPRTPCPSRRARKAVMA